jgi:acetyl esterase
MPLNPQSQMFLDQMAAMGGKPIHELSPDEARLVARSLIEFGTPEQPVAQVENRTIPGPARPIPVRIYKPSLDRPLPVLVYFHGGGWVLGSLDTYDRECRALANGSGCTVISVDYRLAPEHTFPAAVEDSYAALRYIAEHGDKLGVDAGRLAVGGDSAGGTLAAVMTLMARDRGGPRIGFQLLIYPLTDFDIAQPSASEFADGYFLTRALMDYFTNYYIPNAADRLSISASPARAADLSGLPSAMIVTAEYDMLRDQGEDYARRLQAAGVPVTLQRYEGVFHPFFSLGGVIDTARVCHADAASALRDALMGAAAAR